AHFNNAGAALPPTPVLDAVKDYLQLEGEIGGYEAMRARAGDIDAARVHAAQLIGADPRNIAFTASSTDGYARALSAIAFEAGDVIVTTLADYVSNQIAFVGLAERFGVETVYAPDLPGGGVDVDALEALVKTRRPRLVAATHMPTHSGLVQPVGEIGLIARDAGALYIVDACQSAGQLALNAPAIGCDFLTMSFRKFLRGPRGMGVLYVSDAALGAGLKPLFADLHSGRLVEAGAYEPVADAVRFEWFETSYAGLLGAGAAAAYALRLGTERIEAEVLSRAAAVRERLCAIDGLDLMGAGPGAIVPFHVNGKDGAALRAALAARRINVQLMSPDNAPLIPALREKGWALRVSPHYYTSADEIDALVEALQVLAV
ncbi:MAG: aminotransferase class V-fold PLP-dependent enzyme, partial [Pseudomonadota bacterium]